MRMFETPTRPPSLTRLRANRAQGAAKIGLCLPLLALFLVATPGRAEKRSKKAPKQPPAATTAKAAAGTSRAINSPRRPAPATLAAAKKSPQPTLRGGSSKGGNPFARLKVVVPREKLPPLAFVRTHDRRKPRERAKRKKIRVVITSSPGGASVTWGRRKLGNTPVVVTAPESSTPMDLVLRRKGYMVLRTRVQRRISRKYFFKLHPAKFR
jgi:hypothetical protein